MIPSLRFQHVGLNEGLSQTTVHAMLQDRHGFMWFGTQDGLNRYDGHRFTVFRNVPFDTTSLSGNHVLSLAEGPDGALWVGLLTGLDRLDPLTGRSRRFYPLTESDRNARTEAGTSALLVEPSGIVWVGTTSRGLDRLDPRTGRLQHFRHDPSDPNSLSSDGVIALHRDRTGTLWVATTNGLNRIVPGPDGRYSFRRSLYDPQSRAGTFEPLNLLGSFLGETDDRPSFVTALSDDALDAGVLWVATLAGLVRLDTRTGTERRFFPEGGDPAEAAFVGLVRDPHTAGVLWAATRRGGIHRFDIRPHRGGGASAGVFTAFRHDPSNPTSPGETGGPLLVDRTGIIWVSSVGISRFDPAGTPFVHIRSVPRQPGSLIDPFVWALTEDRDGNLWVGTEGGLDRLDRTTGRHTHLRHDPRDANSLSADVPTALLTDRTGALWVGQGGGGLDRLDLATGRVTRFAPQEPVGLAPGRVYALLEDRTATLWVGTAEGLSRRDPHTGSFALVPLSSGSGKTLRVNDLFEDAAGIVWAATHDGLRRIEPATGLVTTFRHDPRDRSTLGATVLRTIYERPREPGILWIGTGGGGLDRFEVRANRVIHFTEAEGLANGYVYGILEDPSGRLWLSTNNGLSVFDPETRTFTNYTPDDGLQSPEFNGGAYSQSSRTGELFFGGINGYNVFRPSHLTRNTVPPQVSLTGLRIFNRPVVVGPDGPLKVPLAQTRVLRLDADHRSVTFEFVGLHYKNPSRNRTAYRLVGFDPGWVEGGDGRAATYTNLAPGRYTFEVKAASAHGVWSTPVSVTVVVRPPWWRTLWAYVLYGLGLLVGLFAVDRVQRRRLVARERERAREQELAQAREIERAYAQLKATQQQLVQQEKLASLGALTAGIAHEIKNPLNFVNNFAALSEELVSEIEHERATKPDLRVEEVEDLMADLKSNATRIREHGQRADSIVKNMLAHSRGATGTKEPVNLNALIEEYTSLAFHGMRAQRPDFTCT
ncbi:MAG TPA: two-component regulator propeller domain-containing protein, partial [Rhodothermales bacterium]|nr:two-component regulator propeller domain-containing protein [Rhodothermales bacterium]